MKTGSRRRIVATGAALALLAGGGSALAAVQAGPPSWAPRDGLQQQLGPGAGMRLGGVVLDAAAAYLGMSEEQLAALRHDGKSLAQIATENGKSVDGLQQALVAAVKTKLAAAVAAGTITQDRADQLLAAFQVRVELAVTRTETGPSAGRGNGVGNGPGYGAGYGYRAGLCPNA